MPTLQHTPAAIIAAASDTAGRYVATMRLCPSCLRPTPGRLTSMYRCAGCGGLGEPAAALLRDATLLAGWAR